MIKELFNEQKKKFETKRFWTNRQVLHEMDKLYTLVVEYELTKHSERYRTQKTKSDSLHEYLSDS